VEAIEIDSDEKCGRIAGNFDRHMDAAICDAGCIAGKKGHIPRFHYSLLEATGCCHGGVFGGNTQITNLTDTHKKQEMTTRRTSSQKEYIFQNNICFNSSDYVSSFGHSLESISPDLSSAD